METDDGVWTRYVYMGAMFIIGSFGCVLGDGMPPLNVEVSRVE